MASYEVNFYDIDPEGLVPTDAGRTFTWSGPASAKGTATILETDTGIGGQTLDDDSLGHESARADVSVGGVSSTGSNVDAEAIWTVQDSVTGETFEVAQLQVEAGDARGYYTLSELPLVAGRSYEVVDYDFMPVAEMGDNVFSYDDYLPAESPGENGIEGSGGDDVIDAGVADAQGDRVDQGDGAGPSGLGDLVDGQTGNDNISAGDGADTVYGGAGQDTISGGAGDDALYGDGAATAEGDAAAASKSLSLNWQAAGADGTDVSDGLALDTGGMQIDVTFDRGATGDRIEISDSRQYTAGGEPFDSHSALHLTCDGSGTSSSACTTLDFSCAPDSGLSDSVANVCFRINGIEPGHWADSVEVNAYDADGNPLQVDITASSTASAPGRMIAAGLGGDRADWPQGSALVEIAGPVAELEIVHSDTGSDSHSLWISDVHFDTMPSCGEDGAGDVIDGGDGDDLVSGGAGDDSLAGGTGADTLDGGAGDDRLTLAQGDNASGGAGDDTFLLTDLGEDGNGSITIAGGEDGESAGDTLDFQGLIDWGDVAYTDTGDDRGGLSGHATLDDGTVVNFSGIENVFICFTAGTRILTPHGPRPIEDLRPGDLVITADAGLQPVRWTGRRTVPAAGRLAPIRLRAGSSFGNGRDLLVSPQHRMLVTGHRANLLFGESEVLAAAKHLIDERDVFRDPGGEVTYVHLLFDRHQVIFAEGAPSESFHPGAQGLDAVSGAAREELFALFPELRSNPNGYGGTSRICLKRHEARLLAA